MVSIATFPVQLVVPNGKVPPVDCTFEVRKTGVRLLREGGATLFQFSFKQIKGWSLSKEDPARVVVQAERSPRKYGEITVRARGETPHTSAQELVNSLNKTAQTVLAERQSAALTHDSAGAQSARPPPPPEPPSSLRPPPPAHVRPPPDTYKGMPATDQQAPASSLPSPPSMQASTSQPTSPRSPNRTPRQRQGPLPPPPPPLSMASATQETASLARSPPRAPPPVPPALAQSWDDALGRHASADARKQGPPPPPLQALADETTSYLYNNNHNNTSDAAAGPPPPPPSLTTPLAQSTTSNQQLQSPRSFSGGTSPRQVSNHAKLQSSSFKSSTADAQSAYSRSGPGHPPNANNGPNRAAVERLEEQVAEARSARVALQAELEDKAARVATMAADVVTKDQEISRLRAQVEELHSKSQLAQPQNSVEAREAAEWKRRMLTAEAETEVLRRQCSSLQLEAAPWPQRLADAGEMVTQLQGQCKQMQESEAALRKELSQREQESYRLAQRTQELEKQVASFASRESYLSGELEAARSELTTHRREAAAAQSLDACLQAEMAELKSITQHLETKGAAEASEQSEGMHRQMAELQQLRGDVERWRAQADRARRHEAELNDEIGELARALELATDTMCEDVAAAEAARETRAADMARAASLLAEVESQSATAQAGLLSAEMKSRKLERVMMERAAAAEGELETVKAQWHAAEAAAEAAAQRTATAETSASEQIHTLEAELHTMRAATAPTELVDDLRRRVAAAEMQAAEAAACRDEAVEQAREERLLLNSRQAQLQREVLDLEDRLATEATRRMHLQQRIAEGAASSCSELHASHADGSQRAIRASDERSPMSSGDAGENGVALAASAQEQVREEVARVRAELEADNAYARGRLDSMQMRVDLLESQLTDARAESLSWKQRAEEYHRQLGLTRSAEESVLAHATQAPTARLLAEMDQLREEVRQLRGSKSPPALAGWEEATHSPRRAASPATTSQALSEARWQRHQQLEAHLNEQVRTLQEVKATMQRRVEREVARREEATLEAGQLRSLLQSARQTKLEMAAALDEWQDKARRAEETVLCLQVELQARSVQAQQQELASQLGDAASPPNLKKEADPPPINQEIDAAGVTPTTIRELGELAAVLGAVQTRLENQLLQGAREERDAEVSKLQKELDEARAQNQEAGPVIGDLQSQVDKFKDDVRQLQEEAQQLREEAQGLRSEAGRLESGRNQAQASVDALTAQLAEAAQHSKSLTAQLQQAGEERDVAIQGRQHADQELSQVRAAAEQALQVAAAESRELEVQLSAAQDQLALLASDVQAKTNAIEALESKVPMAAKLGAQLEAVTAEKQELHQQVAKLETALAEAAPVRPRGPDESTILRAKLTQLSDQLAHYKGTNTRMQDTIAAMKEEQLQTSQRYERDVAALRASQAVDASKVGEGTLAARAEVARLEDKTQELSRQLAWERKAAREREADLARKLESEEDLFASLSKPKVDLAAIEGENVHLQMQLKTMAEKIQKLSKQKTELEHSLVLESQSNAEKLEDIALLEHDRAVLQHHARLVGKGPAVGPGTRPQGSGGAREHVAASTELDAFFSPATVAEVNRTPENQPASSSTSWMARGVPSVGSVHPNQGHSFLTPQDANALMGRGAGAQQQHTPESHAGNQRNTPPYVGSSYTSTLTGASMSSKSTGSPLRAQRPSPELGGGSARAKALRSWAAKTLGLDGLSGHTGAGTAALASDGANAQVTNVLAELSSMKNEMSMQVGTARWEAPGRSIGGRSGGSTHTPPSRHVPSNISHSSGNHKQLLNVIDGILEIVSVDGV